MDTNSIIIIVVTTCITTTISLIITFIFNAIVNGSKARKKRTEELAEAVSKKNEHIERGVQALLRNKLYEIHDVWTPKGYCPTEIKTNYENLYTQYHNLGKNGVMDHQRDELMNLPSIKPIKKKQKLNEGE